MSSTASEAPPSGAGRVVLDARPVLATGQSPIDDHGRRRWAGPRRDPRSPHPVRADAAAPRAGRDGLRAVVRELAPDDWVTEYRRPGDEPALVLDVRGLQPPEPLERTLEALEGMPAGRALLQVNDRVPAFLLPLLDERDYRYRIGEDARGTLVTIWRGGGPLLTEREAWEALAGVVDPELGIDIVELGLVYTVEVAPTRSP